MGLAGTLGHIIERHGEGLAVFRRVVMQYALGIEKAVGEIDADFELFDELGAAELAHRLDDCLIVIVSAGEDVALHTGRDLLVNLVVVDLSETGTSPLPELPLREAQAANAAPLAKHPPRQNGHP